MTAYIPRWRGEAEAVAARKVHGLGKKRKKKGARLVDLLGRGGASVDATHRVWVIGEKRRDRWWRGATCFQTDPLRSQPVVKLSAQLRGVGM
jgi:hypothetical protein